MMSSLGHEVFLYGGEKNEAAVTEFIPLVSAEDLKAWFGDYNSETTVFNDWNSSSVCWQTMNIRAVAAIESRRKPGDILGIIAGRCQESIMRALPDMRAVEWGIGYEGIITDAFHVFESNPWMHYVYGSCGIKDGKFFDAVIPNAFDEEDYIYADKKDDYLLFIGRPTAKKGLEVISELAKRGHRIVSAGQGSLNIPGVEHMGVVRGEVKAKLIAKAKALLAPTFYIEPFGGVVIEALLSGTPVITTDFGAFTETVRDQIDGYRCHTMNEFDYAANVVQYLDQGEIHAHARRYLTRNVRYQYQRYFERLALLDSRGWYG